MKRSTACGPAAKGRRVSSFCCVWCRGLSLRWFDCVNLMHVCGLLLHGISGISTLPRGFLKCLFVTFRVNFTSVLLHHEHLGYKLTLSVANTYATFCSIHLALPMEVWMTTSNSILHIIAVSNLLWSFLWNRHVAFVFSISLNSWFFFLSGIIDVLFGSWKCFLNLCPVKMLLMCMMSLQTALLCYV